MPFPAISDGEHVFCLLRRYQCSAEVAVWTYTDGKFVYQNLEQLVSNHDTELKKSDSMKSRKRNLLHKFNFQSEGSASNPADVLQGDKKKKKETSKSGAVNSINSTVKESSKGRQRSASVAPEPPKSLTTGYNKLYPISPDHKIYFRHIPLSEEWREQLEVMCLLLPDNSRCSIPNLSDYRILLTYDSDTVKITSIFIDLFTNNDMPHPPDQIEIFGSLQKPLVIESVDSSDPNKKFSQPSPEGMKRFFILTLSGSNKIQPSCEQILAEPMICKFIVIRIQTFSEPRKVNLNHIGFRGLHHYDRSLPLQQKSFESCSNLSSIPVPLPNSSLVQISNSPGILPSPSLLNVPSLVSSGSFPAQLPSHQTITKSYSTTVLPKTSVQAQDNDNQSSMDAESSTPKFEHEEMMMDHNSILSRGLQFNLLQHHSIENGNALAVLLRISKYSSTLDALLQCYLNFITWISKKQYNQETLLTFNHSFYLGDIELKAIASNCLELRKLEMTSCPFFTDVGLSEVVKKITSLSELKLSGCTQLTDESFVTISQFAGNLRSLVVWRDISPSIEKNIHLIKGLNNLVFLSLAKYLFFRFI